MLVTHTETMTIGGRQISRTVEAEVDNDNGHGPIPLAAGKTVTDWAKTDGDTAACNLPAGHGFTDGTFDVYTSAGVLIRYGVDGTIATNALTLDGGTGDDFPASATEGIIVSAQQQINVSIDGDAASMIGLDTTAASAHAEFQDADGDVVRAVGFSTTNPDLWDTSKASNPYAGDPITKVMVSNGTTTAGTITIIIGQDSTP